MAKKVLKTRTQFTSTLKKELYKELQEHSKETQIPISRILDIAVSQYLLINKTGTETHPKT